MRRRRSLLSKIIVGVSVAILIVEGILLVPTAALYREELVEGRREVAELTARVLVHGAERRLALDGPAALPELAAEIEQAGPALGATAAYVFDRAGRRLGAAGGGPERADAAAEVAVSEARGLPEPRAFDRWGRLTLVTPLKGPGASPEQPEVVGYLVIATPLEAVAGKVANRALLAMGVVLIVLLLTGIATISALYFHVLRPIGALTAANVAVVEGDEDRALVPPHRIPNDELGDVIRMRNDIYTRMREYQDSIKEKNETLRRQGAELKRWAHELERRVRAKSEELVKAHERLLESEKLAATGRLAAGLAHEINNPLASIAGYAEDLLGLAADPALGAVPEFAEFPESLAVIQEQAFRCKKIIRQLLSFARPAPFEIESVDVGALAHDVLPLVEHKLRGTAVAVTIEVEPGCPPALADRANLTQVFVNLIENAVDAIGDRPGAVEIAIRPGVEIRVTDSGCGIPEADRSKIFDPFFTTKPVGSGTGLGLSIVHGIISRLGGRIEVESEVGKGTTFTIWLPEAAWDSTQVTACSSSMTKSLSAS